MNNLLENIPKNKKVILFDGLCNLCHYAVKEVLRYDKKNSFLLTALQSKTGKAITKQLGINTSKIDSVVLYVPDQGYFVKSTAALKIMNEFAGLWKLTQLFLLFPTSFNDFFYDCVAKSRYKWFGKKEVCMVPTPELNEKFL